MKSWQSTARVGNIWIAIFSLDFFFAICYRQMTFFCAKNIFSSHLVIMVTGSAHPGIPPILYMQGAALLLHLPADAITSGTLRMLAVFL